jgi:hypothetical protein
MFSRMTAAWSYLVLKMTECCHTNIVGTLFCKNLRVESKCSVVCGTNYRNPVSFSVFRFFSMLSHLYEELCCGYVCCFSSCSEGISVRGHK